MQERLAPRTYVVGGGVVGGGVVGGGLPGTFTSMSVSPPPVPPRKNRNHAMRASNAITTIAQTQLALLASLPLPGVLEI
jgi:hypothetical protein